MSIFRYITTVKNLDLIVEYVFYLKPMSTLDIFMLLYKESG